MGRILLFPGWGINYRTGLSGQKNRAFLTLGRGFFEQIAEVLNVSGRTVSRWGNGTVESTMSRKGGSCHTKLSARLF